MARFSILCFFFAGAFVHPLRAAMAPKKRASAPSTTPRNAKAQRRTSQGASAPRSSQTSAANVRKADGPRAALLDRLAGVLGAEPERITGIRRHEDKFSLIDVGVVVTRKNNDYTSQELRRVQDRFPDVRAKMHELQIPRPRATQDARGRHLRGRVRDSHGRVRR